MDSCAFLSKKAERFKPYKNGYISNRVKWKELVKIEQTGRRDAA